MLFGITGEPLQNGHLETYLNLVENYADSNTSVFIMPNAVPQYKTNRMALTKKQAMYQHIIEQLPRDKEGKPVFRFELCELMQECKPGGFNVLTHLRNKHPDWEISLAIGMDSFLNFDVLWHNWQQIPGLCNLIILERQGHAGADFSDKETFLRTEIKKSGLPFNPLQRHNPHSRELSSTQCVKKLKAGEDCSNDIPKACLEFIYSNEGCFKGFATPRPNLNQHFSSLT